MEYKPPEYKIFSRPNNVAYKLEDVAIWSSLSVSKKWCDIATWELTLPYEEFIKRWELSTTTTPNLTYGGIQIYRDNTLLIAGPIVSGTHTWEGDDDTITLSGMSDAYWLTTRIVWPDWRQPYHGVVAEGSLWCRWGLAPWYDNRAAYWSNTGYPAKNFAGNIMTEFVEYNLGATAWSGTMNNKWYDLAYDRSLKYYYDGHLHYVAQNSDDDYGIECNYQGRFESLYDTCRTLSHAAGAAITDECHFDIVTLFTTCPYCGNNEGYWEFQVSGVSDKTDEMIFGDRLGTINSYEITETRPEATVLMVGGPQVQWQGVDTNIDTRLFQQCQGVLAQEARDTYGNIELFYDADTQIGDSPSAAMYGQCGKDMVEDGDAELADKCFNVEVNIELRPAEARQFYPAFDIGDLINVQLGDLVYTDVIREINFTVDPDGGEVIEPIVASNKRFKGKREGPYISARDAKQRAKNLARRK